jgi:hypothetical protein
MALNCTKILFEMPFLVLLIMYFLIRNFHVLGVTESSAAEILKTIVIASQNAGHQQILANSIDSTHSKSAVLHY